MRKRHERSNLFRRPDRRRCVASGGDAVDQIGGAMNTQERTPKPAPKIIDRMRAYHGNVWRWHDATCRFCGSWNKRALKYGTRHYACVDCVSGILLRDEQARAAKAKGQS